MKTASKSVLKIYIGAFQFILITFLSIVLGMGADMLLLSVKT